MRLRTPAIAFLSCLFVFNFAPVIAQTNCPPHTKFIADTSQPLSALNAGWFVYSKSGVNGLFKSDLKSFSETLIPGTDAGRPTWADISDNGQWIVYLTSEGNVRRIFLIKPDGTGKKEIPITTQPSGRSNSYPSMVRFYRSSPVGYEIAYQSGYGRIQAVSYTEDAGVITVGQTRVVVSFPIMDSVGTMGGADYEWEEGISVTEGLGIWRDQLVFESWFDLTQYSRPGYLTIPDNGNGTGGSADMFAWNNPADTTTWGCGHTMSHDGLYCVSNAGFVGSECVPCKNATVNGFIMDHKGFYVTPFMRKGEPGFPIVTLPDSHGLSTNWCPPNYQYGLYNEINFIHWNFTNDNSYVVGAQIGNGTNSEPTLKGIWLVNWQTNAWYFLTPRSNALGSDGTTYMYPSAFFTEGVSIRNQGSSIEKSFASSRVKRMAYSGNGTISLMAGIIGAAAYSPSGRLLWKSGLLSGAENQSLSIPGHVLNSGCAIIELESAKK